MTAPFATVSLADMDAHQFPETEWDIEGIVPGGTLGLLVGRPKAGKSLFAVDLLASLALGETFLDRATRQASVLYVPAEDHIGLVRERMHTRFGRERDAPFHVLPADGSFDQALKLDDDGETLVRLAATIAALRVSVIVLDPMRELHTAKENDADEMAVLLRPLRQMAHAERVTILLVHHRNKHGLDPSTAVRGSSAITGGVDFVMTLDVNGDADDDLTPGQTVTLRVEGRYGAKQRIVARLGAGLRWKVTAAAPPDSTVPTRILRLLANADGPQDAEAIAGSLDANKRSVQNALKEMVAGGAVARLGKGTKSAPYAYAHPSFMDEVRKGDGYCDASPEKPCDESGDEYSVATQRETPHSSPPRMVYPPRDVTNIPSLSAAGDVTHCDESGDESGDAETADDPMLDAWDVLIKWAHGKCLPFTDAEREAAATVGLQVGEGEAWGRVASRIFAGQRAWREGA